MVIESPITLGANLNVNADIAEIIKARAENYGIKEYIYAGDGSIRIFYLDKNNNRKLNENVENCKCEQHPYVKKNKNNVLIKVKKEDTLFKEYVCNCKENIKELYNHFKNNEIWSGYKILQIDCKICRKYYKNPDYNNIDSNGTFEIFFGSKPNQNN
jgi:hypothetical protein